MTSRREFLAVVAAGVASAGPKLTAQSPPQGIVHTEPQRTDSGNLFAMDQNAWQSVRLPPKPGAQPSMTNDQRDALEHTIRCQCGCTLDVFTCRTTDFSCQVSPAMHRDVMAMVAGGYTGDEIIAQFKSVYGERVLMAPPKEGFNIVGWVLPGVGVSIGAVALLFVLRSLGKPAVATTTTGGIDASPEELAKLDAAVRDDS